MKKIFFYSVFLIIFSFYLFPAKIYAQKIPSPGDIVINELMWMGSSASPYDEWIELRNMTDSEIDLSGWQLTKKSNGKEKLMLTIPDGYEISPKGYFLIADYDKEHSKINTDPDLVVGPGDTNDSNFALVNNDLQIRLYNGPYEEIETELIDEADDGEGRPLAGQYDKEKKIYYSMERNEDPDDGTLVSSWHTATTSLNFDPGAREKGTPKAENSKRPIYSDKIIISEILPNPYGLDKKGEFIELYNQDSQDIDLEGWRLEDASGNSYTFSSEDFPSFPSLSIKRGGYFLIYRSITGLALNNRGSETLRLLDPNGVEVDKISYIPPSGYKSVPSGWSYNRIGKSWFWSTTPTPGKANLITKEITSPEEEAILTNISGARRLGKGIEVIIQGVVTVPPGPLGSRIFYLQDQRAGIQIYSSQGKFPLLKIGDRVKIQGETSEISGEKRIKVVDIKILGHGPPPFPLKVKTGNISLRYEGRLVRISGRVVKTSGSTFYLDDGSGSIKVYLKSSTKIKKPKMAKGDFVEIVGIVSQTKTGFRILPRFQQDLLVFKSSKSSKIKKSSEKEGGKILGEKAEAKSVLEEVEKGTSSSGSSFFKVAGWIIMLIGLLGLILVEIYSRVRFSK